MFEFLLLNQLKGAFRYFRRQSVAKFVTVFLFLAIFALIAIGIYLFFEEGFSYLYFGEEMLYPMLLYFYEIFFLILGGIIFFSTLVTGMFSLWRGSSDEWFVAGPAYQHLPFLIFAKSILNGLWPLLIVFLPTVLAMQKVFHLSTTAVFSILFAFICYLFLVVSVALALILIFAFCYHFLSKKISWLKFSFGRLFLILLVFVLSQSYLIWNNSVNIDIVDLFEANNLEAQTIEVAAVAKYFTCLPSHPLAMNTLYAQLEDGKNSVKYLLILQSMTILALLFLWKSSFFFLKTWQALKEGGRIEASTKKGRRRIHLNYSFGRGGKYLALFEREILVFVRNPRNLVWMTFLIFIYLMQISINYVLAQTITINDLNPSTKNTVVEAIQFVISTYFISAFVLRFVFPSFSSERKTLWILDSAPISTKKIFYIKYLFFGSIFLVLSISFAYLNLISLNLPLTIAGNTLLLFAITTLFITALGLSLGAIFPNYETDDPGVISTTLPGLFFIVLSLAYGTLGGFLLYYFDNYVAIYLYLVLSLIILTLILSLTPRLTKLKGRIKNIIS